jgi:hypothetical protein
MTAWVGWWVEVVKRGGRWQPGYLLEDLAVLDGAS